MKQHQVAIGVGSNISPAENIQKAKDLISQEHVFICESDHFQTEPIGIKDQPDFINCAFFFETDLSQKAFKQFLKNVEDTLDRDRSQPKFGPRTIDLDIVVWDGEVVDPDMETREFLKKAIGQVLNYRNKP